MTTLTSDFEFTDHGSIVLLAPQTEAAHALIASGAFGDAPRWGDAIAVERNYADALADALAEDGYTVTLN